MTVSTQHHACTECPQSATDDKGLPVDMAESVFGAANVCTGERNRQALDPQSVDELLWPPKARQLWAGQAVRVGQAAPGCAGIRDTVRPVLGLELALEGGS